MGHPFDRDQVRKDVKQILLNKYGTFDDSDLSVALQELASEIDTGPDWRGLKRSSLHTYRFTAVFELPFHSKDQGTATVMHHLVSLGLADLTLETQDLGVSVILGDSRP